MSNVKIELLTREHDRQAFDCGVEALNRYLRDLALQHHKRNTAKTHILVHKEGDGAVLAYATLNVCQISTAGNEDVPAFKGLPRDVPALRLCRLAVAESRKKQGLGQYMMGFVLAKAITISQDAGLSGILVDAKNEDAKGYYQLFGFVPLTTDPMTLFLPMASIMALVGE